MSNITYTGANSSVKIAGVLFKKGAETDLTAEQAKAVKADRFGKAFLDDGTLVESDSNADNTPDDTKPIDKMTVKELEAYIKANGGEFTDDDNKPELLKIAQGIADNQPEK